MAICIDLHPVLEGCCPAWLNSKAASSTGESGSINDVRALTGQILATDKHMSNLVLADARSSVAYARTCGSKGKPNRRRNRRWSAGHSSRGVGCELECCQRRMRTRRRILCVYHRCDCRICIDSRCASPPATVCLSMPAGRGKAVERAQCRPVRPLYIFYEPTLNLRLQRSH